MKNGNYNQEELDKKTLDLQDFYLNSLCRLENGEKLVNGVLIAAISINMFNLTHGFPLQPVGLISTGLGKVITNKLVLNSYVTFNEMSEELYEYESKLTGREPKMRLLTEEFIIEGIDISEDSEDKLEMQKIYEEKMQKLDESKDLTEVIDISDMPELDKIVFNKLNEMYKKGEINAKNVFDLFDNESIDDQVYQLSIDEIEQTPKSKKLGSKNKSKSSKGK
jgi:hypothetical protein